MKNDPTLYQTMQQIWPGITVKKPDAQFWEHEWDKHGAFSSFTQYDYFKIAVKRANDLGVLQLVQELNKPPAGGLFCINLNLLSFFFFLFFFKKKKNSYLFSFLFNFL